MNMIKFAKILLITMLLSATAAQAAENTGKQESKTDLVPRVTGMVNLRYVYDEQNKNHHGFEVRRIRLGAMGNLHKNVDYKMQAEYIDHVRLLDAYVRWKIMPELNVQAGQFKVQYSMEGLDGPANWLTVELPVAVNKLNGYSDLSGLGCNGRDIGLMLYGSLIHKELFDVLTYRVGVFNGNGNNLKDDNRKKDVAGMLWVNPVRQMSLTGSYYYGTYGPRGNSHTHNRASAGVQWKDRKLHIRSEYLWGNTAGMHSHGAYAQVAYTIHRMIQPSIGYDYFRQDERDEAHRHTLQIGVNVSPIDHLRLQAGYVHAFSNTGRRHNNLAEMQCVVTF